LASLINEEEAASTVVTCLQPLLDGSGSLRSPAMEYINDTLSLLPGDIALSKFEQEFSRAWPECRDGNAHAFAVTTALWQLMQRGAEALEARLILVDLAPNLGAINRAALIATDHVVVPLSPDIFSLKGLDDLGPTLREWRAEWAQRVACSPTPSMLPSGAMQPIGYIVWHHSLRLDHPISLYDQWMRRIPHTYHQAVLADDQHPLSPDKDEQCLSMLKHYRGMMPLAREARKPIFHLRMADGALGSQWDAVQDVQRDFNKLAREIARRIGLAI
jgi:hypothetical protein